ncbi:hypothetical protein KUTeg_008699 [Tegillarca granosa]|uniref:DUF4709 domain-containing protein n=1 Tax=Tegillarca granosa TaxID=220873 RepID=A0ABQ9F9W4_TEGGR|nr:hypothetical protein KUTeg_008699 [Tegillarca granosa]
MIATKMAAVRSRDARDYFKAEQELQDHILDIYGNRENDLDLFRPSLADQHKVGFFSLDRCSQTEITEVVDLKEMTEVIQILLQDVKNLRRDINFTKHVMQADYESKVQEKSTDLYCRINEKVDELEKMHEERVGVVRRAFRQQLADAIARVSVLYNKNLERKIRSEKQRQAGEQDKIDEKYKELQATIQRNDMVIQMLKNQLAQYQQQKIAEEDIIEELSIKSRSPSINPEMEELREEVDNLMRKIERMEEDLLQKDDETNTLTKEIENLSLKLQEEKATAEKYKSESDNLKSKIEQDMASSKRIISDAKPKS